jgi:hypothetical protein
MIHPSNRRWPLAAAALVALAAAPAIAKKPAPEGGWQMVTPDAQVVGVDGNTYAPSCTGFPGTDPTFKFWAKKSLTGSRKTMVYFEGGGACWDNFTCSFPLGTGLPYQFFLPQVPPATNPATMDGAFKDLPANPVKDWNVVYIPYCSGDIHTGSTSKQYYNAGFPQFPAGTPFTLQHRGFDNFMSVLAWMNASADKPQQILVTGSSAGGYGATANFPWIAETFKSARVSLLADASQGVTTTAFDNGDPGRNSWSPQLAPWVFGPAPSTVRGGDLIRAVAHAYPQSKIAQFTTPLDTVQWQFYGIMKQQAQFPGNCPNPAIDWNQQMLADLELNNSSTPNYRHYVAAGSYHTLMRSPLYFTEASAGETFAGWLGNMLKNQGGTGGKGGQWESVACPTCLEPVPCQ